MGIPFVTADKITDHISGRVVGFPFPANIWATVFTADSGAAGLQNNSFASELNVNGFARVGALSQDIDTSPGTGFKSTGIAGFLRNLGTWNFGQATGGPWTGIASIAIVNSGTLGVGDILIYGDLSAPVTVNDGEQFEAPEDSLDFDMSLNNNPTSELSTYSASRALEHLLGITSWTIPGRFAALFWGATGLTTNAPTQEVTESSYARQAFGNFADPAGTGSASNLDQFLWAPALADYDNGGNVTHHAAMDAVTGGNVLCWDQAPTVQITAGKVPRIDPGNFTIATI